jgi:molybdopterin-guanine dinucleotide biosynthesis protein A
VQLLSKLPLTAAILAGGKSSRMNMPKCLIPLGNTKIIDILISKLKGIFEEIFIVTNFPELYFYTGIQMIGDIYPFKGPMAGIHSALKNSKYDVMAFACDMPFIRQEVIYKLFDTHYSKNKTATVPLFDDKIYPLPGIYSKKLLNTIEGLLIEDKLSMRKLLDDVGAYVIEVANLDKEGVSFININTFEDLEILKSKKGGILCLD